MNSKKISAYLMFALSACFYIASLWLHMDKAYKEETFASRTYSQWCLVLSAIFVLIGTVLSAEYKKANTSLSKQDNINIAIVVISVLCVIYAVKGSGGTTESLFFTGGITLISILAGASLITEN